MSEIVILDKTETTNTTTYKVRVIADVTFDAPKGMAEEEACERFRKSIDTRLELPSDSPLSVLDVEIADFLGIEHA